MVSDVVFLAHGIFNPAELRWYPGVDVPIAQHPRTEHGIGSQLGQGSAVVTH